MPRIFYAIVLKKAIAEVLQNPFGFLLSGFVFHTVEKPVIAKVAEGHLWQSVSPVILSEATVGSEVEESSHLPTV